MQVRGALLVESCLEKFRWSLKQFASLVVFQERLGESFC
jgi:hypothetical protein